MVAEYRDAMGKVAHATSRARRRVPPIAPKIARFDAFLQ